MKRNYRKRKGKTPKQVAIPLNQEYAEEVEPLSGIGTVMAEEMVRIRRR
jgi:hypothetical protein